MWGFIFIAVASFISLIDIIILGHSKYSSWTTFIFPKIILMCIGISAVLAYFGIVSFDPVIYTTVVLVCLSIASIVFFVSMKRL